MPPRWRFAGITFVILCIFLLFRGRTSNLLAVHNNGYWKYNSRSLANETLGFQKIITVSGEDPTNPRAWRRNGLIAAANHTGLVVHVEDTSNMPAEETDRIMNLTLHDGTSHPQLGSSRAWAAHERVLQQLIADDISSALILEDDVDWELDIRKLLAPDSRIASAIRRLSASDEVNIIKEPYGNTYDVIWLGHCGIRWYGRQGPTTIFNISWPDELVLPAKTLAIWDGKPFDTVPTGYRQVRLGTETLCTLGYGITRNAAQRLLKYLAKGGGYGAFDIELNNACMTGVLRCLTINPEIMHDQNMAGGPGSIISSVNSKNAGKEEPAGVDIKEYKPITWNIRYSARCNAGWTGSPRKQCLPERQQNV